MTTISKQRQILIISIALVAATLVAYEPIRHNGFVSYDDPGYISSNPLITAGISWQSLGQAFTKPHYFMWHPLTTISHMLDCQLFGLNPVGHHLTSVVIHIVNVLLVFWIFKNFGGPIWISAFVAPDTALHTTTGFLPICDFTISATTFILSELPTDVPPNFITIIFSPKTLNSNYI